MLYDTRTAADYYGLTRQQIRNIAKDRGVGRKYGRDWFFTPVELKQLKPLNPKGSGRKKNGKG